MRATVVSVGIERRAFLNLECLARSTSSGTPDVVGGAWLLVSGADSTLPLAVVAVLVESTQLALGEGGLVSLGSGSDGDCEYGIGW